MTGPDWPRRRYELLVKKGTTPLGLKLHQTKTRRGVYTNGFADGPYPPPGPQACMRVGDMLVSVDGKDVLGATLPVALSTIETARRRDRLRDFISSKQDDARRGSIGLIFERVMPKLTFRDVVLDPRKVVYLLNFMLEVRAATSVLEQVSLDEARLMFWLEAHLLFEMAAVMTPSRADMAKIFDKFFREESGFFLNSGIDERQLKLKHAAKRSLDGRRTAPKITTPGEDAATVASSHTDSSVTGEPQSPPAPAGVLPILSYKGSIPALGTSEERDVISGSPGLVGGGEGAQSLPMEFQASDLSRMFKDTMEKVEETLTAECFFRYTTSPWFGRMVAHLSNSPDFVHVPFASLMAESELRDVMMLHMIVGQLPGWLQVWREVELAVKPRMVVLQTRRSVRAVRRVSAGQHLRVNSTASLSDRSRRSTRHGIASGLHHDGGSVNGHNSASNGSLVQAVEAKADAAVAILASATYLWDFFLSDDAHASIGVSQESNAYGTLRELLEEGGVEKGSGSSGEGGVATAVSPDGGDAGVDAAVAVGKALMEMQRHVLRKLCASIYPSFQASPTYEQLCDELTAGARSPARAPPAAADKAHDKATMDDGAVAVAIGGNDISPAAAPTATNADNAAAGGLYGHAGGGAERIAWPPPRQLGPHGKPESPFAFLGNSPERRRNTHLRRSTSPGLGGSGGDSGDFVSWAEALAFKPAGCKAEEIVTPTSLSGPDFRTLWEASRGSVLEKVMRRIELPSHISRHRPPLGGGGAGGGTPGVRRLSRSGSGAALGSASPELREHLSLPPASRRFGRRPYPIQRRDRLPASGGDEPPPATAATATLHSLQSRASFTAGDESKFSSFSDGQAYGWQITSPPGGSASGRRLTDGSGVNGDDLASVFGGGVRSQGMSEEEGPARVSEWVVAFSSCLEHGLTNVKAGKVVRVGCRGQGVAEAAPEGLEPFFCPELPANGKGPCYCSPETRGDEDGTAGGRSRGLRRGCPSPRLFTFAAPGRNGAGMFYGACLSVFRPVAQWVGEEDAGPDERNSDTSTVVSPTTAAAPPPTTTPTAASNTLSQLPGTSPVPSDTGSGGLSNRSDATGIGVPSAPTSEPADELTVMASTSTGPPPPGTANCRTSVHGVSSPLPLPLPPESASEPAASAMVTPTASDGQAEGALTMDPTSASAEVSSVTVEVPPLADGGDGKGGDKEGTKTSPVPAVADVPSRFKMAMGMFSGSARSSSAAKSSAASAAGASASAAAGASGSGKDSNSSSSGPSKFSSYAGRARNFLGASDSRTIGRSPRAGTPATAPTAGAVVDNEVNGPPPPEPRAPFLLGSPPIPRKSTSSDSVDTLASAATTGDVVTPSESAPATIPRTRSGTGSMLAGVAAAVVGSSSSSGGTESVGIKSGVFGSKKKSVSANAKVDENAVLGDCAVSRTAERGGTGTTNGGVAGVSTVANGVKGGQEGSGRGEGAGDIRRTRRKHVFYVPSGLCLLSSRPETGAMRQALSAYWLAHGEKATRKQAAPAAAADHITTSEVVGDHDDADADALAVGGACRGRRETIDVCGEDGSDEGAVSEEAAEGCDNDFIGSNAGPWAGLSTRELEQLLAPFLTAPGPGGAKMSPKDDADQATGNESETEKSPETAEDRANVDATASTAASARERIREPAPHSPLSEELAQTPPLLTHPRQTKAAAGLERRDWSGLDFDPSVVLRCLSPRRLCMVMTALLCERKVVMVSGRLSLLTMAGELFRALLYPLVWSHVYVPLLPRRMAADLLQCPTPFLLGLHSETARGLELPKDAVQVHLDTDFLLSPADFVGLAPMSTLCSRLSALINPGLEELDSPYGGGEAGVAWTPATSDTIRAYFREFTSELLQGAAECTFEVGQGSTLTVLLDERLYKKAKAAAADAAEQLRSPTNATPQNPRQIRDNGRLVGVREGGDGGGGARARAGTTAITGSEWEMEGGGFRAGSIGPFYNSHCEKLLDQFVKTQMLSHYLSEGIWEA